MALFEVCKCDVLVVGAGAAGMRAALEAHLQGVKVILAVKGAFSAIGVRGAGASAGGLCNASGMLYAHDKPIHSGPEKAYQQAVQLGLGLADPKLIRVLVEDSLRNRSELAKYNIFWPHVADRGIRAHGVPITSGLSAQISARNVEVHQNTMVFHLLVKDGQCAGAVGVNEVTGQLVAYEAAAVILATGGDGQLFWHNLDASCVTGDGYAAGYQAGAKLTNLEFMQVFIAIIAPTRNNLQIWNWARPPKFLNAHSEEFLEKHCPSGVTAEMVMQEHNLHDPASTRDRYSRYLEVAILHEVRAGRGTPRGGVWMDFRGLEHTLDRQAVEWLHYRGIRSDHDCIEVSVCHHCSNGGFVADGNAQTSLPGLYAVGETMGGAWGADRRGGFMLAATQVFGSRAGIAAARRARQIKQRAEAAESGASEALELVSQLTGQQNSPAPAELKQILKRTNWEDLLFERNAPGLQRVLETVKQLRQTLARGAAISKPFDLVEALELSNMLLVSEMVARASLLRSESRGGHYRSDYPDRNDKNWQRNIGIQRFGDQMHLEPFRLDEHWDENADGEHTGERWG